MWPLIIASSTSNLILLFCRSKDVISSHLTPHLTCHHYQPLPFFFASFEAQNSSHTTIKWGTLNPKKINSLLLWGFVPFPSNQSPLKKILLFFLKFSFNTQTRRSFASDSKTKNGKSLNSIKEINCNKEINYDIRIWGPNWWGLWCGFSKKVLK